MDGGGGGVSCVGDTEPEAQWLTPRLWSQTVLGSNPTSVSIGCVALGKSLNLSEAVFLLLKVRIIILLAHLVL